MSHSNPQVVCKKCGHPIALKDAVMVGVMNSNGSVTLKFQCLVCLHTDTLQKRDVCKGKLL